MPEFIESDALMRMLIPDRQVNAVAELTGLSRSLLYMERRPFGDRMEDNGTRNTIARLDLICEFALGHNTNAVRLVGKRYDDLYRNAVEQMVSGSGPIDLLATLSVASREVGEALSALAGRKSLKECSIEVEQAKAALEKALRTIAAIEAAKKEAQS